MTIRTADELEAIFAKVPLPGMGDMEIVEVGGEVERHYGPGPHPGTGTSQEAHAGAGATAGEGGKFREPKPSEFVAAFEKAMEDSPFTHHVTHYTEEELGKMKGILLSEDGQSGMAVKDHGDGRIEGTALFSQDAEPGTGRTLLLRAIKQFGVNYVEAFDPWLPAQYARLGFREVERFPFDPAQAPPGWDSTRFDSPDYVTMVWKGEG